MTRERKTLKGRCEIGGVGLHSGTPVTMSISPSEEGIHFRLNGERVKACPSNVTDTVRSTKIGSICTVEHLMSAFCGLEITDAEVELNAPELPGLDGSAMPYVHLFREIGLEDLESDEFPDLYRRIFFTENNVSISIGKGEGSWRFQFDTGERWPGTQIWESKDIVSDYARAVAPSRTVVFQDEIKQVIDAGLGQGLDIDSVLIIGADGYDNLSRFPDEPARHKLLDLLGDLYLSGVPAKHLSVVAERSGHRTNVKAAALLLESLS